MKFPNFWRVCMRDQHSMKPLNNECGNFNLDIQNVIGTH